jgi:hypothetical protein
MPNTTSNQNRPIANKGSTHVAAATTPDVHHVDLLPAVHIPFPNTVPSTRLLEGATTNTFIGKQPIWTEAGALGPLSDPEHDWAKPGIKSKTYRLEAKATSWAADVYAEGKAVIRTYDTTTQNHANTEGLVLPDALAAQLADPTLPLKLPKGCEYLRNQFTVQGSKKDWARMRNSWSASGGEPIQHQFPGDPAPRPALRFSANVGGRSIPVIVPRTGTTDAGRQLPTPNQIAQAIAILPAPQLSQVQSIQVSPRPSPHDAYWQAQYNDPTHVSAASAGNPITFYPAASNSQEWLDSTMIHEAGHNVHAGLWTNPAVEQRWRNALTADNNPPSQYAQSSFAANGSMAEDFAESLLVWSLAKNGPCEAYARRLYPNRMKELDRLYKPAPPATPRTLPRG